MALNLDRAKHPGGETEVRKFDVSSVVDEEVLWLEITMNIAQVCVEHPRT